MQQYKLHLRVHYAVDLDSNSSFTNGEMESSGVTWEAWNKELTKATGTGRRCQSAVLSTGPWMLEVMWLKNLHHWIQLKFSWPASWTTSSTWFYFEQRVGAFSKLRSFMNFYSEKCVINCSYIAHTPKFLKCCYNNAFKKKKSLSQHWPTSSLFRNWFWKCFISTMNIHYSRSENPKHFSQKPCSFFGWIIPTIFHVPFHGGESKPRLQREDQWCFTTYNIIYCFLKWKMHFGILKLMAISSNLSVFSHSSETSLSIIVFFFSY